MLGVVIKKLEHPVAIMWMNLEGVLLGEICQRKTNAVRYYLYMESKNQNKLVSVTEKK